MTAYTILVAEDDRVSAETLLLFLKKMGHSAAGVFADGEKALQAAGELRPDLAILDIHLSGEMNGVDAAVRIADAYDIPVILLTGEDTDALLDRVGDSKAACLIKKPVLYEELRANIRIAMRQGESLRSIREESAGLQALFDNSAAGMYRCWPDGTLERANHALARLLGYDSPDDLRTQVKDLAVQYYVDAKRRQELLDALHGADETTGFESQVFGRDGQVLWVSEYCRAVSDAEGRTRYYQCVVQDITEKKRAEQELHVTLDMLRRLVASIQDMVFLVDLDHRVILCNEAFARHTGASMDAITGRSVGEVFPAFSGLSADKNTMPGTMDRSVADTALHFTGPDSPYHMSVSPFTDASGDVIGAVYVCRRVNAAQSAS